MAGVPFDELPASVRRALAPQVEAARRRTKRKPPAQRDRGAPLRCRCGELFATYRAWERHSDEHAGEFPHSTICAVVIGKPPRLHSSVTQFQAPEPFTKPAEQPPPFDSNAHYDAKAWRFVSKFAVSGSLFWNVAGVV